MISEEMLGSGDNPAGTKLYLNFLKKKMEKEQQQDGEKNKSSAIEKLKKLKMERLAEVRNFCAEFYFFIEFTVFNRKSDL